MSTTGYNFDFRPRPKRSEQENAVARRKLEGYANYTPIGAGRDNPPPESVMRPSNPVRRRLESYHNYDPLSGNLGGPGARPPRSKEFSEPVRYYVPTAENRMPTSGPVRRRNLSLDDPFF